METEKLLGFVGAALSAAGLVATLMGAEWGARASVVLGLVLMALAIWALSSRRPLYILSIDYSYEVADPSGNLAHITRSVKARVLSRHVTTLWARSLTTTGHYENFFSNLGKISYEESTGGGLNVRVDMERPLRLGSEVLWVLKYDARGAFTQKFESVSISGIMGRPRAELNFRFHPSRVPRLVRRIMFRNGVEYEVEPPYSPNEQSPEVTWRFRLRPGAEHSLHWEA